MAFSRSQVAVFASRVIHFHPAGPGHRAGWLQHGPPQCRRYSAAAEEPTSLPFLQTLDEGDKTRRTANHQSKSPQDSQAEWRGRHMPWYKPRKEVILDPCNYISGLPSKRVCSLATDMLNKWIKAPESSTQIIKKTMELLQDAWLVLDDVQDNSPIRRGKPAVHTIFGLAQAVNSSGFMTIQAIQHVRQLKSDAAIDITLDEMENIFLGQSLEIYWKFHLRCPSEEEYLNMVDNKTGPFFRIIARLLQAEVAAISKTGPDTAISFDHLTTLLGRYYQIRDDYMNLRSSVYTEKKGSCEDLNEGKFSYPVVHCLINSPTHRNHILGIFRQRPTIPEAVPNPLSAQAKSHLLSCLEDSGALRATLDRINELEADIETETAQLESFTGVENPALRSLMKKLSLANGHE